MEEVWKDIDGFEGLYQVSNLGNIRSTNFNRENKIQNLKFWKNKKGYYWVDLSNKNKRNHRAVHRLVAKAFLSNEKNYPCINHKNEIKTDNRVENLEWCTYSYNSTYGNNSPVYNHAKIYSKNVMCIETGEIYNNARDASKNKDLFRRHICDVCNGKRKTAGGFHWKYC